MSPIIFTCPLCGWRIYEPSATSSWMNEFRGLYLCSTEKKITLTGVGLYSDPEGGVFIAPPNTASRYDDDGYNISEQDQFGTWGYAVNNRRGFPMHDACWKLLEEAIHPEPVPLDRLFDVLDSLISAMYGKLDWGYKECCPPDGCAVKQSFPWEGVADSRQVTAPPFSSDPFSIDVDQILSRRFGTCEVPAPPANISSGPISRNDPFLSLPEELCTAIAFYLPTQDALHARLASRSFWHLFDCQQFWASRFIGRNSDLSWLFEVRRHPYRGARDWRWLYHQITDKDNNWNELIRGALHNRQHIWLSVLPIVEILELRLTPKVAVAEGDEQVVPKPGFNLRVGGTAAEHSDIWSPLKPGCRRRYKQYLPIPQERARISASTIMAGSFTYIAGLSVVSDSQTVKVGYIGPKEKERSIELDASKLRVSNVAVGLRGIHALLFADSTSSAPWLGDPDDAAITTRLGNVADIAALEVWSDGFRLVEIAIVKKEDADCSDVENNIILRNSAVWYPDIPPAHLNLNEEFFFPAQSYTQGFKPLFWTHFGGPGGIYLKDLHRISWSTADEIMAFEFQNEDVPLDCRMFGRAPLPDSDDEDNLDIFDIDGPGGERITAIEISQKYYKEDGERWLMSEGALALFKVCCTPAATAHSTLLGSVFTNRGRYYQFEDEPKPRSWNVKTKLFTSPPGYIITGFYGAQFQGLVALGVITELEP
ncbi:hypothetical protein QC762_607670 [Podospora pseudocomata]|uniref:F-box domain-containing protein n=1 Tax=Podospora pseudocomata TaxID=2093779 RepID=A0ABR0G8I5_9PEZI|nr:hypothetical protein QC762_607670 [Podospora pseudocomata]